MTDTSVQQAAFDRFTELYRHAQSDVLRGIERAVCGCDYGATSWTTREEAHEVGKMLDLKPGKRLLDVGSGSGWPGLYLAGVTGCDVAMTDLPLTGLRVALERATTDRVAGAFSATVASGAALPFRDGWFDAVLLSDVLCCLPEKRAVLESCRRTLRADGRMVFSVISITPGLGADDYQQAAASGPPFIEADVEYPEMLRQTGWTLTDHRDLTAEYGKAVSRMLDNLETHAGEVAKLFGDDEASSQRAGKRETLEALDRGMLRRELFGAVPSAAENAAAEVFEVVGRDPKAGHGASLS